nr:Chain B, Helicon FP28136 [synthetic construct]7UX5_D Chain D, Helicon FP28136 [synthetic construct]7UX5_F Chain F, Helicon FP28136 [synthetic construct]7UX5_H Chain H, Helicon FP28136 [synthetic construct]7UX5_J Chain J, Helicon FP28136 [synthetic construct]7UX5_L Chain L, Helicon FP28136 [synthetic construct]
DPALWQCVFAARYCYEE